MRLTAAQKALLESDERLRQLERAYSSGDNSILVPLAWEYLRHEDSRINKLIKPLIQMDTDEAHEVVLAWREKTGYLSSAEFLKQMHDTNPKQTEFETAAVKAGLKPILTSETGRSGYYYDLTLYANDYDDDFIWRVYGSGDGTQEWNYGLISKHDLEESVQDYGGEDEWESWGALDYFRDYLYDI